MNAMLTLLVIVAAYWLGFLTAAILAAGKDSDMNGHPNYLDPHNMNTRIDNFPGHDSDRTVKESLTTQPEWRPPMNWRGEEAVDEIGTTDRCAVCTKTMLDDSHVCETCIQKHSRRVNV